MQNALTASRPPFHKGADPLSLDKLSLPPTSVDAWIPWGPSFIKSVVLKVLGIGLQRIALPEELEGKDKIPSYALQEFHNLPNGYYSLHFTEGYAKGFNLVMLGEMARVRSNIARELSDCSSVLDLGCGDGCSTQALCDRGIDEVWGLDPSPYMLLHAMKRNKSAQFVHAAAEQTPFLNESFDGISACWVFHEIPPKFGDVILSECFRILKPGGKLVLAEPSKHQFRKTAWQLFKEFGLKGAYFRFLARHPHEPFIQEWHDKNIKQWLENHGFQLVMNTNNMPEEFIVAVKV